MAIHKPWDRPFFVLGGSVMKNGFSLNLAEGQFGIFNVTKQTPRGSVAVESFKGFSNNTTFELKLGRNNAGGRTLSDKKFSSFPFALKDVVDVRVSTPQKKDDSVDELIIGYNGIDADTSIQLYPGDEKEIYIKLQGKALEYIGAPEGILDITVPLSAPAKYNMPCGTEEDPCSPVDMLPIINWAVQYLKDYDVMGVPFETFAEVSPVIELQEITRTGNITSTLFTMSVCDSGDAAALALVQQQYPDLQVVRILRKGATSTYQVAKTGTVGLPAVEPVDYTQTIASVMKGCDTCPSGYEEVEGGILYAVAISDSGLDVTTVIEELPHLVSGTAKKADGQDFGVGFYTVLTQQELTDSEIATFITTNPTAIVEKVGPVASICVNGTISKSTWTTGTTVHATTRAYKITLPDTECGESRLEELQKVFPNLVITETGLTGGCQREYATTVPTNFLGTECSEIFVDVYRSEAPASYEGEKWVEDFTNVDGTGGKYGIRLKGKKFKLASGECLRDKIGYTEDSVKIEASGGYIRDFNLGVNYIQNIKDTPFKVTRLSRWTPRTHVAGNMLDEEKVSRAFFSGIHIDHNYMGRILTNTESNLIDLDAQLVDYVISLRRVIFAQGLAQRVEENIDYHVLVEVGRHEGVEDLVNALAAGAGLPGVQAFGEYIAG